MESIILNINYGGTLVKAEIFPEENMLGTIYPVEMNGRYAFTLMMNEDDQWLIVREPDGTTPFVENELFEKIIKKLQYQLRYAA